MVNYSVQLYQTLVQTTSKIWIPPVFSAPAVLSGVFGSCVLCSQQNAVINFRLVRGIDEQTSDGLVGDRFTFLVLALHAFKVTSFYSQVHHVRSFSVQIKAETIYRVHQIYISG